MIKKDLEKLDKNKSKALIKALNPVLPGADYDEKATRVTGHEYSFYPGFVTIELTEHITHPPRRLGMLADADIIENPQNYTDPDKAKSAFDGRVFIFDGTNEPIYKANSAVPLSLDSNCVREYIRFFFSRVRGRHGRFVIVETVDEIDWREDPPPAARRAVAKMIAPLALIGSDEDNNFYLRACLLFKDSLFKARISVDPQGQVDITEEEIIIEEMPVFDDTLTG
mgnify:CR=1 FL=1